MVPGCQCVRQLVWVVVLSESVIFRSTLPKGSFKKMFTDEKEVKKSKSKGELQSNKDLLYPGYTQCNQEQS